MDRPHAQFQASGPARSLRTVARDASVVALTLAVMASLATIVILVAGLAHGV